MSCSPSVLHLVAISIALVGSVLASTTHSVTNPDSVRQAALVSLQRGMLPDSTLVVPLLTTGDTQDSILAVSVLLAAGDTTRALQSHPHQYYDLTTVSEDISARLLLVRLARGEDVIHQLVRCWQQNPSSVTGTSCLFAAMETPAFNDISIVEQAAPFVPRFDSENSARWHAAAGNLLYQNGLSGRAVDHWWNVLAAPSSPYVLSAAESLLIRVDTTLLSWERREQLARSFLNAGRADAALALLKGEEIPVEIDLLRAKGLLSIGQSREGRSILARLAAGTSWISAQAAWELATYEKRSDRDTHAADAYLALSKRHPNHYLADNAQWEGAWALERSGKYYEAGAAYEALSRNWPRSPFADRALLRWGLVAWRNGDIQEAARRWQIGASRGRTSSGKAAIGYWLGKAHLHTASLQKAFSWWAWAAVSDSSSFYGSRSLQRLDARWFRTRRSGAAVNRYTARPDLAAWIRSWGVDEKLTVTCDRIERARDLHRCGFVERAADELRQSLTDAVSSPVLVGEILATALRQEDYRVSIKAAQQLAEDFEATTGRRPPCWLLRLIYPIPYADVLSRESSLFSVDYRMLAALIRKESFYTRTAVSRSDAVGLMQLLPRTAARTASNVQGADPRRLTDVLTNVRLGTCYLNQLLTENDGNEVFALAGYNAGPHNTERWRKLLEDDDVVLWLETITYGETRDYIKGVLAFWHRYRTLWPADPRNLADTLGLKPDLLESG